MTILGGKDFFTYWNKTTAQAEDAETEKTVKEIIASVRENGDAAVKKYAAKFDKSSPQKLEVPFSEVQRAYEELRANDPELAAALELAAENIFAFSKKQKEQFAYFETELKKGLFTGQRVIPVQRAGIYVPGGRFPLFSSVLMGLIPAFSAGAEEVVFASPPQDDGIPDKKILAAAAVAVNVCDLANSRKFRVFAMGGAQAIAALAFGTETVPRVDVIAGPGNKYVAEAKRLLYGQVGIDFIAGPSDVLVITTRGGTEAQQIVFAAADMIAQAEHDPDARARALVPNRELAEKIAAEIEKQLQDLPTAETVRSSLDNGGLIVIYKDREEAAEIANAIAPEHLELFADDAEWWVPKLKNYGSLFIGESAAEVLGDYSAGLNHTLPTSCSARFTGGLSVRNFLKTATTLRCTKGDGFEKARNAAEILAIAEGLEGHAQSAKIRKS